MFVKASGAAKLFGNWRGDVLAGLTVAVTSLPFAIACGSIAFAPVGPAYLPLGVLAAVSGTILTSIVASIFCSCPIQVTGARASLATIAATLLIANADAGSANNALALLTIAGLLAGAFQVLLGLFKVGRLIAYIPYPVIAGFMNGVAALILISQVKLALGIPSGTEIHGVGPAVKLVQPIAVITAFATAAVVLLGPRLCRQIPGPVQGIALGFGLFELLHLGFPGQIVSPRLGAIPLNFPDIDVIRGVGHALASSDLWNHLWPILPFAWSLAFTGSIEALMNAASADASLGTRTDANRELLGQGLANIVSASFGGLLGAASPARTFANYGAGGRTPLAGIAHGLWLLLFFGLLQPVIARLPIAVTAGMMIAVSITMIDRWSQVLLGMALWNRRSASWRALANLAVVALVAAAVVLFGLAAAIVAGLASTSAIFLAKLMSQPVHRSFRCGNVRSKKIWAADDLARLQSLGNRIHVHCLQGEIFFGTIEPLSRLLKQDLHETDIAIIDFRKANQLDATAVRLLQQFHRDYRQKGKQLVLSGLTEDHPAWAELRDLGAIGKDSTALPIFADLDSALEWAERALLSECATGRGWTERPLEQTPYFSGLSPEQVTVISSILKKKRYQPGDSIYTEGSFEQAMLFLTAGSVSVLKRIPNTTRSKRLAGLGPGKVVGEMAILTGKPRSADVRADEEVIGYELVRSDFDQLIRTRPEIGIVLLKNLGADLATRVDVTSHELVEHSGTP